MVEQEAVNFEVASSSLAGGAIFVENKTTKKCRLVVASLQASLAGGAIFLDKKIPARSGDSC